MNNFWQQCEQISGVDRQAEYGDARIRLATAGKIDEMLGTLRVKEITREQRHCMNMIIEKLTRGAVNPNKPDTWLDLASYGKFMIDAATRKSRGDRV